jgi:hypothetical protein
MSGSTTLMTADQFRATLPAFRDPQQWVTGEINAWLNLADKLLPVDRWEDLRPLGMALFTAHNLVLSKRDEKAADAGQVPGSPNFIQQSKSVGAVSVSYDTSSGLIQDAGAWNLTTFGTRFYMLMQQVGMGGVQIGYGPLQVPAGPGFGSVDITN